MSVNAVTTAKIYGIDHAGCDTTAAHSSCVMFANMYALVCKLNSEGETFAIAVMCESVPDGRNAHRVLPGGGEVPKQVSGFTGDAASGPDLDCSQRWTFSMQSQ